MQLRFPGSVNTGVLEPVGVAPLLVLGWGNPSRGDDALGPLCVQQLRRAWQHRGEAVEFLEDFQLQVEHALDLVGRRRVLLVDASRDGAAPFTASSVQAARDASYTTHALSAQALLQVFVVVQGHAPPPCTLLAIRGTRWGLGDALSDTAAAHLQAATQWALTWLLADQGAA